MQVPLWRPEVSHPCGTGVTGHYKLPNMDPGKETPVVCKGMDLFLTIESYLQHHIHYLDPFWKKKKVRQQHA